MEKYMKALSRIEQTGIFMTKEPDPLDNFDIYKMVDNRIAGLIEVAIGDLDITEEEFSMLQAHGATIVDKFREVWMNGILEEEQ